ncbi:TPA: hypothetical protein N0F65_006392 [Lagenidium giganteum]|uniref:Uncharacterized protein n=1 Tax=Lagenidium giganteum TaxID=4803 RepID=A0AAV2YSZ4_9STRA|nr:TPA: hypothetical protein N0F65_006392 [Lagenidium giganteum]
MTLVKLLYRELLRTCRVFDQDAARRAMLSAQLLQPLASKQQPAPHVVLFNRQLVEFLRGRSFFWPSRDQRSLRRFVQDKFRASGGSIDTAFLALKVLNDQLAAAEELGKGSTGIIVNHPLEASVMKSFRIPPDVMETMGANKVHSGGPVPSRHAEILHAHEEFGGKTISLPTNFDQPSAERLFFGADVTAASEAIKDDKISANDVMWIKGMSGWSPGQLEGEMRRGAWVAVRAPLSLAIHAKRDLWEELMTGLGGEYQELVRIPDLGGYEFEDDDTEDEDDNDDHRVPEAR